MNIVTAKEFLPIVKAMAEGKIIQKGLLNYWKDVSEIDLMSDPSHYRIKPEPRRWWIVKWSESKWDIAFCEQGARAMACEFPERYCEIIPVEERIQ